MKYKVGDRVKIKSLDWYTENKDEDGDVYFKHCFNFIEEMKKYCGNTMTIEKIFGEYDICPDIYKMKDDDNTYSWTEEMIECIVEESKTRNFLQEYLKERNIPETSLEANSIQEGYTLAIERVCQFLDSELYTSFDYFGNVEISSKKAISKQDFLEKLRNTLMESSDINERDLHTCCDTNVRHFHICYQDAVGNINYTEVKLNPDEKANQETFSKKIFGDDKYALIGWSLVEE
jgi:exonuclease III